MGAFIKQLTETLQVEYPNNFTLMFMLVLNSVGHAYHIVRSVLRFRKNSMEMLFVVQ